MITEPVLIRHHVPLHQFTSLAAGGPAEYLAVAHSRDELEQAILWAKAKAVAVQLLGWGTNVLPSDSGVSGLVIINRAQTIQIEVNVVEADSGAMFQDVFLRAAQASLEGLEFAVGIPGSLGGALVSNAGAYRSNISAVVTKLDVVQDGVRKHVDPSVMQFSYRDSILRQLHPPELYVLGATLTLEPGSAQDIYNRAREFQRQRISKQPPMASAGSFFKNVEDRVFAERLADLPEPLRLAGVVPAGFLIERCGLRGYRLGGAMIADRHANFIANVAQATASEIRELAAYVKDVVKNRYGVVLEEEVLYIGDWPES